MERFRCCVIAIAIALAVICGAALASAVSFIIVGLDSYAQQEEPGMAYIIIGVILFLVTIVGWSGCMYVMLFRPCVSADVVRYSLV